MPLLESWLSWLDSIFRSIEQVFKEKEIRIIIITGPSGAGKTTIVEELLKNHPEWRMIVSLTSRGPRESDLPGEYMCEIPKEEFIERDRRGELIWMVNIHGNIMATSLIDVCTALESRFFSLMQLTPDAVKKLRAYAPEEILSFFILPPNEEELRQRLAKRGESPEDIDRRIIDCKEWENKARSSDIPYNFVKNDGTVEDVIEQIEGIIRVYTQSR